jgi:hypothetical protein
VLEPDLTFRAGALIRPKGLDGAKRDLLADKFDIFKPLK